MPLTTDLKRRIEEILKRAALDIDFSKEFLTDPHSALQDSGLSWDEMNELSKLRSVSLEEWGIDVRSFRSFLHDNGKKTSSTDKLAFGKGKFWSDRDLKNEAFII